MKPRHPVRISRVLLTATLALAGAVQAQSLVEWTEGPGPLGLGYPVPIPEDTPLPFDGFRSYAGLHARHQQLLIEHDSVTGAVVGTTIHGRDIWMYRFGDPERPDVEGRARPALLINGGIHAREWQSPEVVTGLLELLVDGQGDEHWISYLRDNVNILTIPVQNVDGFLQTQRYPRSNYLGSDPQFPASSPRDGRMRRKNMRDTDEVLATVGDHRNGIDLNRNNAPFWPGAPINANPQGLTYRGVAAGSEPETQALYAAAELAPADRLRFFSDMHSFTRVFFSVRTGNARRNAVQANLLSMLSRHHHALPGNKNYVDVPEGPGSGLGTTSEYFAYTYQIPSLTWEIEPGNSAGVEYGGFASNGHSGFILPDSQIRRVRENLAETLAAAAYRMAGPPHLQRLQVFDPATGALLLERRWRLSADGVRVPDERVVRALEPGRDYDIRLTFNKPMRWRNAEGSVAVFPGQMVSTLALDLDVRVGTESLAIERSSPVWAGETDVADAAWHRYRDDTVTLQLRIVDNTDNRARLQSAQAGGVPVRLSVDTTDMTGQRIDADPSTPVDWREGAWSGYENSAGVAGDVGGSDHSQVLPVSLSAQPAPLPIAPGHSAAWYDPARSGEGFLLENLDGERAVVYWFTYDEDGRQRWLNGLGRIDGNRVHFPNLFITSGGRFGPDFDPADVERIVVADGEFWFRDCDSGWFDFRGFGEERRFELVRTAHTLGLSCSSEPAPTRPEAGQSGSWYDPAFSGQGFALQWLRDDGVLVMWFSYDPDGRQYWMVGTGALQGDEIVIQDLHSTRGARFGSAFNPGDVERSYWGDLRFRIGCTDGEADYASVHPEFGAGQFHLRQLTRLHGLECP